MYVRIQQISNHTIVADHDFYMNLSQTQCNTSLAWYWKVVGKIGAGRKNFHQFRRSFSEWMKMHMRCEKLNERSFDAPQWDAVAWNQLSQCTFSHTHEATKPEIDAAHHTTKRRWRNDNLNSLASFSAAYTTPNIQWTHRTKLREL